MKYRLIIIFMLLFIGFVSAEEGIDIKIENNTLTIEGYSKNADFGKFPAGFINSINENLSTSLNCETLNLTVVNETDINHTYSLEFETNCLPVLDYDREIKFYFNVSSEDKTRYCIGDSELMKDWLACERAKDDFESGYTRCTSDNFDKAGLESNLTTCNTQLQVCKSERTTAVADKKRIEDETEDNKNQRWTYGIGGIIIGVIGTLWYTGRIGGAKTKKDDESYNPTGAG